MNMNMYGCYGNSIWYDWICMTHGSTIEMSYLHGILSLRSPWPYPRNVHGFGYCILPLHVGHSCAWNMSVHTYIIYATIYMNHVYMQDLWGPARWHITNAVIFDVYMSAIVCHLRLFLPWQNHRYGFKLFASTKCIRMSHPLILVIPSPCVPDLRCRVCVIATTPWIYIYIWLYMAQYLHANSCTKAFECQKNVQRLIPCCRDIVIMLTTDDYSIWFFAFITHTCTW